MSTICSVLIFGLFFTQSSFGFFGNSTKNGFSKTDLSLARRSSESQLTCGNKKLPALGKNRPGVAYEILLKTPQINLAGNGVEVPNPNHPSIDSGIPIITSDGKTSQLLQDITVTAYECVNSAWSETQFKPNDYLYFATTYKRQVITQDKIRYFFPAQLMHKKRINLNLEVLMGKVLYTDYRSSSRTRMIIQIGIAPLELKIEKTASGEEKEVPVFDFTQLLHNYFGNYSLTNKAEILTEDAVAGVDPLHAYTCGELSRKDQYILSHRAEEEPNSWFYRIRNLYIYTEGDKIKVSYKLYAAKCAIADHDQKAYWQHVPFPKDTRAFIGKFDGFVGYKDLSESRLFERESLKKYIDTTNKYHGALSANEQSPINVELVGEIKDFLSEKDYKKYSKGETVSVQMSMGIRSNYTLYGNTNSGGFSQPNFIATNFVPYPFFKSDFFLNKNSNLPLYAKLQSPSSLDKSLIHSQTEGLQLDKNYTRLNAVVSEKIDDRLSREYERCAFEHYMRIDPEHPGTFLHKYRLHLYFKNKGMIAVQSIPFGDFKLPENEKLSDIWSIEPLNQNPNRLYPSKTGSSLSYDLAKKEMVLKMSSIQETQTEIIQTIHMIKVLTDPKMESIDKITFQRTRYTGSFADEPKIEELFECPQLRSE